MSLTKKAILKRTPVLLYACLLQNEHCIEADRMPPLWVQFRLETRARRPTCPIARIAPAAVLVSIQLKLLCFITTLVFAALGAAAILVTSPIGISTKARARRRLSASLTRRRRKQPGRCHAPWLVYFLYLPLQSQCLGLFPKRLRRPHYR